MSMHSVTICRPIKGRFVRGILVLVVATCAALPATQAATFMAGADISSLPIHENNGAVYRDDGQPGDAVDIFSEHGMNWFRLRLFVNPQFENNYDGGYDAFVAQDLAYTINLAQRIKQAGGKVLLDFHYSDTWADPAHQIKPEAWTSLSFNQLQQRVYDYTKQSIEAFSAAGVLPEMVQIGNEIANGMLWSDGQLWRSGVTESQEFNNLAALVSAGINGARDGAGAGQEPLIMIHHDKGSQWGTTSYYFDRLLPRLQANGTDVDVLGFSYYPKWHSGGMAGVQQNLNNSAAAYDKPVVIVETGFPSRCPSCEPMYEFPVSAAGQQQFLETLVDVVQDVPNDMGLGVFWWYAEARPTEGLNVWEGGRYGLFDQNGNLLPAAMVFEQFLDPTLPGDINSDGSVDAADYTIWRKTSGSLAEFNEWRANFGDTIGNGASAGASAQVPESVSVVGFLVAISAMYLRPRRLNSQKLKKCL